MVSFAVWMGRDALWMLLAGTEKRTEGIGRYCSVLKSPLGRQGGRGDGDVFYVEKHIEIDIFPNRSFSLGLRLFTIGLEIIQNRK